MKPFNRFTMNNSFIALDSLQEHKQFKANGRRLLKKDQDRCLFCNKPMDVTNETIHVHLTTDGNITSLDDSQCENSQGCFPIGNECAKKIDKSFYF